MMPHSLLPLSCPYLHLSKPTGLLLVCSAQDLVDSHIFVDAQKVVDALKQHDCRPALAWCSQHAAKLKKIRSRLEFKLCLQVRRCH